MAKVKVEFACTACGTSSPRWAGKCPGCGEWNTLVEEVAAPKVSANKGIGAARRKAGSTAFGEGGHVMATPTAVTATSITAVRPATYWPSVISSEPIRNQSTADAYVPPPVTKCHTPPM